MLTACGGAATASDQTRTSAGVLLYFGITRGWLARLLSASVLQLALCGVCGRAARKRAAVSRRRQLRRKRGVCSVYLQGQLCA